MTSSSTDSSEARTIGIALVVPEPWGTDLQEARAEAGDLAAWTIATHLTLLPPTRVPRRRLQEVDQHLQRVAAGQEAFSVQLAGSDTFRPVTPTVFLRVDDGAEECVRLQERICSGPLNRRLRYPYHPHVTLAFDISGASLDGLLDRYREYSVSFSADSVTRFELGEDGVWLPAREFALAVGVS